METTIYYQKQTTTEGGESHYRRGKTKFYAKVEDDIYDLFDRHEVTAPHAMIYMALSGCLLHNSEFAKASYKALRKKGRAASDETVRNALNELSKKGFISKMGNSTYRLWHCVYKGIREDQKEYSEVIYREKTTTANVVKATTANVVPHVRDMIHTTINKQLQSQSESGNSSPFSKLSKRKMTLAKRYVDLLQQNGMEIKGFTIYVESVCEKSEKFGTWDKLEQNVKALEDKLAEKETDRVETEKSEETRREKVKKENSENKTKLIQRTKVLADIESLPLKQQETLRLTAQDRLSEGNQWVADKIKSRSSKSDRIIENMIETEMMAVHENRN